jgi:membrane-associated phospholipid phosphatase
MVKKIMDKIIESSICSNGRWGRISSVLSYILHPVLFMIITAMAVSFYVRHNIRMMFSDAVLILCGLIPGTVFIYFKKKRGDFGSYHLLLLKERAVVLPVLLAGLAGSLAFAAATKAPTGITSSMAIALLEGIGVTIISRFWKISLHAAVAMGCASLMISISLWCALVACVLAILVGIARLIVNHHTLLQVVAGWIYGFALTRLLAAWFNVS